MLAAIDWADVTVAAAFILGAIGGTIATIRITRAVFDEARRERIRRRADDDDA